MDPLNIQLPDCIVHCVIVSWLDHRWYFARCFSQHWCVTIPVIVKFFLMLTCVESPRYLVSINRIEETKLSLQKLRPYVSIDNKLYDIIEGPLSVAAAQDLVGDLGEDKKKKINDIEIDATVANDTENHEYLNLIQVFTDPLVRRFITVLAPHTIQ